MAQKNYNLEVIGALLKGENHVRGIAKMLGTNHMRVNRVLKELKDLNAVDLNREGKNNVYFLKDSVESREFSLMYEHYSLLNLIRRNRFLRRFVEKIQSDDRVRLALVFGSYAKGLENGNSDVDVFIETKSQSIKKKYSSMDSKINIKIGNFDSESSLGREIIKNHVILKGAENYYERVFS